jgi:hypothetical protein
MKLLFKVLLCLMLALALIGCKKADVPKAPSESVKAAESAPRHALKEQKETGSDEESVKPVKVVDNKRKLIKEGELSFETSDMDKTTALIHKAVKDTKGYIAKETQDNYGERARISLVIRVPQDRFDELVNSIASNADTLDRKNIETKDVTEEYVDTQARLKTRLSLENRYRQLLGQAGKMDDILKIEKQLGGIREEIEAAEGRLKYLNDRVEFSTLTVVYYQRVSAARGFGQKFGDGLKDGWSYFAAFFIALAHLWPFIIIVAVVVMFVRKFRKKKPETKGPETKGQAEKDKSP